MIWESIPVMTMLDLAFITVAAIGLVLLSRARRQWPLGEKPLGPALIALGLVVLGLFYTADLFVMFVLPSTTGRAQSMVVMEQLHLNYSWIAFATSAISVAGGAALTFGTVGRMSAERKQTETDLRESEERFRVLAYATFEGIIIGDPELVVICNPQMAEMLGYDRPELIDMEILDIVAPEFRELVRERIGADDNKPYRARVLRKDGTTFAVEMQARTMPYHGRAVRVTAIRDITDRLESDNRFQRIVEAAPDGIVMVDGDGKIMLVNQQTVAQFGYTREELIGQPVEVLVPPESRAGHPGLRSGYMVEPQDRLMGDSSGLSGHRKDGTEFPVEIALSPIVTGGGAMVMATVRDITVRKRTEEETRQLEAKLEQAAKMEAIGQLAGGVAHDFNNLLTVILGRTELLTAQIDSSELQSDLDEILKAGTHAASLTHQLLAFSRKQVLEPKVLDLRDIVSGVEGMVRRLIPENIQLTTNLTPKVDNVRVDRNQVEQVILNVAVNARDAMPGGGTLTIDVLNAELTEDFVLENVGANAGPHVLLAIHDTGTGMDAETVSRVFEPFFTTKEGTRGTGLGLATVYGIVKQSGGYVRVQSELGEGTTFEIYFPRTESESGDGPDAGVVPAPARERRAARVLLVEDDPTVRALLSDFLSHLGHEVLEAEDAADAIRIFEGLPEPVDLLLTDVVMPHLSGPELAKRLRALSPSLKVLFVSGYANESLQEHIADLPGTPLLSKPFTFEELSGKVEEILASVGSGS